METKDIKLTKTQLEGAEKIIKWLKVPVSSGINGRVFRLTGKAGTGKTTLLKYALKELLKNASNEVPSYGGGFDIFSETESVIGVAMAHKAKNVLSKSIPKCTTFASYFGLAVKYHANGEMTFEKPKSKSEFHTPECEIPYDVVVHDEISMYDKTMADVLFRETNPFSKIILMGDPGQLPPVNSDGVDLDSPLFSLDLEESSRHHLEERVRQTEGNPIVGLSDIVYNEIFGGQNIKVVLDAFKNPKIENDIGYETITYAQMLEAYKASSQNNYMDSKIIAYKNAQVNAINQVTRNYVHDNPDFIFIENECIYMMDSFTYRPNPRVKPQWTCYNSDEYLIKKTSKSKTQGVDCFSLFVDKKGHKHLLDKKDPFINVVSKEGEASFNKTLHFRKKAALEADYKDRGKKWKFYYDFANNFGKVSYGYCFTGYKAQGSTYKTIFVDVNDILTTGPITAKRKLQALYTAITRASHKVVFLKAR